MRAMQRSKAIGSTAATGSAAGAKPVPPRTRPRPPDTATLRCTLLFLEASLPGWRSGPATFRFIATPADGEDTPFAAGAGEIVRKVEPSAGAIIWSEGALEAAMPSSA